MNELLFYTLTDHGTRKCQMERMIADIRTPLKESANDRTCKKSVIYNLRHCHRAEYQGTYHNRVLAVLLPRITLAIHLFSSIQ